MMMEREVRMSEVLGFLGRRDCLFVDLRSPEEYRAGHLRGSWNIPFENLESEKGKLRGWRKIFLYCDRGNNSLIAYRSLRKEGYPVVNLWGGVNAFQYELNGKLKNSVDYLWEKN